MVLTEEKKEYFRNYYKNNKEKYKTAIKKYLSKPEAYEKQRVANRRWHTMSRKRDKEKWKEYDEKNKFRNKQKTKNWHNKNKEKVLAEKLARKNVPLKDSCEICGSKELLIRHHWDYNKPLLVNTLCRDCHMVQHTKHFERYYF